VIPLAWLRGSTCASLLWTSERTGRFTLIVERSGYFPWTAENRAVTSACSVRTVAPTARLVPRASAAPARNVR